MIDHRAFMPPPHGEPLEYRGSVKPPTPRQHCLTLTRDNCVAIGLPIALRRSGRQSVLAPRAWYTASLQSASLNKGLPSQVLRL
jgi:hypothetical protein